jgi:hypothetical protein
MENFDQQILDWVCIAKGDSPGHEFHGNQYTHMGSQAQAIENRAESMFHRDANGPERNTWGGNTDKDFADIISAHRQLEADHRAAAASEYAKGNTKAGDLHIAAARAHGDAGYAWRFSGSATGLGSAPNHSFAAYSRSGDATRATNHAVSNSSPDGVNKGAQTGHPFEGNQYVSGSNQASEARRLADAVKDGSVDHFTAERQHRAIARACEEQANAAHQTRGDDGLEALATAYDKAAQAHRDAASAHIIKLTVVNSKVNPAKASEAAAKASEHADDLNYA